MRRTRLLLQLVAVVAVVGGWSASVAYAGPVWMVKGSKLGSGETASANLKFGKLTIKWEDSGTKTKFEVECQKASGEAELKGGNPGKDSVKSLKIKECALLKGATGCELATGVSTEELPGWATELEEKSEKIYDTISGMSFGVLLEGCEKASFSKTWLFRGNVKTELKNETGKLKAVLPVGGVTGDTFKSEGAEATISGEGSVEEKLGGSLEFKIESSAGPSLHWYVAGGSSPITLGESLSIESLAGLQRLVVSVSGTAVEIHCEHLDNHGTVTNPSGGGPGLGVILLSYLNCIVKGPSLCMLPNESIHMEILAELEGTNAAPVVKFTPLPGNSAFTELELLGCETGGLNTKYTISGSLLGKFENRVSGVTVHEVKGSSSMLKFASKEATLEGEEDIVEMEGGGKIEAKE